MTVKIDQNIDLSKFCTYGTGGPARYFATAKSWRDVLYLREFAKKEKLEYLFLGGGSNILFDDKGFNGLVIYNKMTKMHIQGNLITAESGANLSKVIMIASQHNLGGISGLATIPGTIGGAVYGNAGIPDICIGDTITNIIILPEGSNKPKIVNKDYAEFRYRNSKFKESKDIIISATMKLKIVPGIEVRSEINKYIKERSYKQPVGKTCGSFFQNPSQFPSAGWLIEQSGCKGIKIGDAMVSDKHANFIMNTGKAKSSDIIKLTIKIKDIVKKKFNVDLEPEVQIKSHS